MDIFSSAKRKFSSVMHRLKRTKSSSKNQGNLSKAALKKLLEPIQNPKSISLDDLYNDFNNRTTDNILFSSNQTVLNLANAFLVYAETIKKYDENENENENKNETEAEAEAEKNMSIATEWCARQSLLKELAQIKLISSSEMSKFKQSFEDFYIEHFGEKPEFNEKEFVTKQPVNPHKASK